MPTALARTLEMGGDWERTVRGMPDHHFEREEFAWLCLSGIPRLPDFNFGVVAAGSPIDTVDRYLTEVRERGLEALLLLEPDEPALLERAERGGLSPAGTFPVMVWTSEREPLVVRTPAGCMVRRCRNDEALSAADLCADAFGMPRAASRAMYSPTTMALCDVWVAEQEGQLVGTALYVNRGTTVAIYNMAVAGVRRGRGIGRAMLTAPMAHYRDGGTSEFVLAATEDGMPLYTSTGYVTVEEALLMSSAPSVQFSR